MTTRSGCEKTKLDPHKDLIKIGLVKGEVIMAVPCGIKVAHDYRPSFDTKLILSQAVAQAIFASVLSHFKPGARFPALLREQGMALAHWHSDILIGQKPRGWYIYGITNPAVSCSTHQAAIYAFRGKEKFFSESLRNGKEYEGEIHIEPHHGVNVTYPSLTGLGKLILGHPRLFKFGALKSKEHRDTHD